MGWILFIPATKRELFEAAVDCAKPSGPDMVMPGAEETVALAKTTIKLLAKRIRRPFIYGYASGVLMNEDAIHIDVFGDLPQPILPDNE